MLREVIFVALRTLARRHIGLTTLERAETAEEP